MNHVETPRQIIKKNIFQIQPTYSLPSYCYNSYLEAIEQILNITLEEWFFSQDQTLDSFRNTKAIFSHIQKELPIVHIPTMDEKLTSIPITFLCPAEFTHGAGRYIADTFSRWLIPGKQLPLIGQISLNFHFTLHPSVKFYMIQEIIGVSDLEELHTIYKNFPSLINEMKINIMAVYQARYITSLRSYSMNDKKLLIQENLNSLIHNSELNSYDQVQQFITQLSSEEKINQVKKNLTYLLRTRPKAFDRDTFHEIRQHINLFTQEFLGKRNQKHLSRIIAYQHLFKKVLQEKIKKIPLERHLSTKVINCYLKERDPITCILIGMTLVKETERFECRHLQETIKDCLPSVAFVEESFLIDRRHEKILFLYIEIYKPTVNPVAQMSSNKEMYSYSINEIKSLKQKLPIKLIRHIETVIHPIFMPRNEEEILRNIIVLANQIKYIRDLPQLSIHYEKQTDTHLFFTVILVRLKLKNSICLDKLFSNIEEPTKINIEEIRIAGYLKKKHPKEAAILHICIEKESFFRSDYSIDLLKARQRISSELMTVLGEFRDFNGGMIIQQDQAISHLRQIITPLTPYIELLLANYFYSIRPMIMQTIHDRIVLKTHFEMLLQIKENKLKNKPYLIHHKKINNFYFYWIQAIAPTFKDSVISETGSYANELTHSFLQIDQDSMLGFILREGDEIINNFHQMLSKTMERWGESTLCPVNLIAQL